MTLRFAWHPIWLAALLALAASTAGARAASVDALIDPAKRRRLQDTPPWRSAVATRARTRTAGQR